MLLPYVVFTYHNELQLPKSCWKHQDARGVPGHSVTTKLGCQLPLLHVKTGVKNVMAQLTHFSISKGWQRRERRLDKIKRTGRLLR